MHTTHTFVDAFGIEITYYVWQAEPAQAPDSAPQTRPRGVVQIAHGVGEYALRYTGPRTSRGPATPSTPTTTAATGRRGSPSGVKARAGSAISGPAACGRLRMQFVS